MAPILLAPFPPSHDDSSLFIVVLGKTLNVLIQANSE